LCCNRREHDLGRGHSEIGAVVFPNAEEIDLKRIGKQGLLGEIANDLRVRQGMAIVTKGNVTKCIQPEFKLRYYRDTPVVRQLRCRPIAADCFRSVKPITARYPAKR
jgi:hypothetical protein